MIGKIPATGTGFRGSFNYVMQGRRDADDPDRVAWAVTRNLVFAKAQDIPSIMRGTASQSARCKKPVYHMIISWRPEERPTDDAMRLVADTTLADLGLEEHQAVIAAHNDTEHRHLHIIVNRVHPGTGKAWHTSKDWARMEMSIGRQAKELGFEFVPGRHNTPEKAPAMDRRVRNGEHQMAKREAIPIPDGKWSPDTIKAWRVKLSPHFAEAKSWDELARRLADHDLRLERKGQGLVIAGDAAHMKLSDLGKGVRLGALEADYNEPFAGYADRMGREAARMAQETERQAKVTAAQTRSRGTAVAEPASASATSANQGGLTEAQRAQLREAVRAQRSTDRASKTGPPHHLAASGDNDDDAPVADMASERKRALPVGASRESTPQPDPRSAASDEVAAARTELDMAEQLFSLGLTSKQEMVRAREAMRRAQAQREQHETMTEFVGRGVAQALAPTPAAPKRSDKPPDTSGRANWEADRDDDQDRER